MFLTLFSNSSLYRKQGFQLLGLFTKRSQLNRFVEDRTRQNVYPNTWFNIDADKYWLFYERRPVHVKVTLSPGGIGIVYQSVNN